MNDLSHRRRSYSSKEEYERLRDLAIAEHKAKTSTGPLSWFAQKRRQGPAVGLPSPCDGMAVEQRRRCVAGSTLKRRSEMTLGANPIAATIVSILITVAGVYLVQQAETTVRVFGWTFLVIGVIGTIINIIMWRERRQRRARARTNHP